MKANYLNHFVLSEDAQCKYFSAHNNLNYEKQVIINKNTVTIQLPIECTTANNTINDNYVIQSFNFTTIIDVIAIHNLLYILQPNTIYIYSNYWYEIPLPFTASSMFHCNIESENDLLIIDRIKTENIDELPSMFSLSHPLNELRPIGICEPSIDLTSNETNNHHIACVSKDIFITYYYDNLIDVYKYTIWQLVSVEKQSPTLPNLSIVSDSLSQSLRESMLAISSYSNTELTPDYSIQFIANIHNPFINLAEIFFANDENKNNLLCFLDPISKILVTYIISINDSNSYYIKPSFSLSCLYAAPISIFSSIIDILFLDLNGEISLFSGSHRLCKIIKPNYLSSSPIKISDVVENHFSIYCANNHIYRLSLTRCWKSGLVNTCFEAFSTLSPYLLTKLRIHLLTLLTCINTEYTSDDEWTAFCVLLEKIHNLKHTKENPIQAKENSFDKNWQLLLASNYHRLKSLNLPDYLIPTNHNLPNSNTFLLYECNIEGLSEFNSNELFYFLHLLYEDFKLSILSNSYLLPLVQLLIRLSPSFSYSYHYSLDFSSCKLNDISSFSIAEIPNIYGFLSNLITKSHIQTNYPVYSLSLSRQICLFYCILTKKLELALHFINGSETIKNLLKSTLYSHNEKLVLTMAYEDFDLSNLDVLAIGIAIPLREILNQCSEGRIFELDDRNLLIKYFKLIFREDLAALYEQKPINSPFFKEEVKNRFQNDIDGTERVVDINKNIFRQDLRLFEVRRILRCDSTIYVRTERWQDAENGDKYAVNEQQLRLSALLSRRYALPLSRGIFTIFSIPAVLTEPLPIPTLKLNGTLSHKPVIIESENYHFSELLWVHFHNGVASGLRITPTDSSNLDINRTWILHNRKNMHTSTGDSIEDNAISRASHAGLLFALGLNSHLNALIPSDYYSYLSVNEELTSVGFILGIAAAKRGSRDPGLGKIFCLHIPSYLGSNSEFTIPPLVHIASLLGIGILFLGSCNRLMAEILLAEVSPKPTSDGTIDYYQGTAISAGIALGLVLLGKGLSMQGLTDLRIEDKLSLLVLGGHNFHKSLDDPSSCIKQGAYVHTETSAPGALAALALMFLKTNNASAAARIKVPETRYHFEQIRPEILFLRVVTHSLILFDSIEPTFEWVETHIPDIIKLKNQPKDPSYARNAFCFIVAGSCIALALKYAGTCNQLAYNVVFHYLGLFKALRSQGTLDADYTVKSSNGSNVGRQTIEHCLAVTCCALGVIMAGSGDLKSLTLLRSIHTYCDTEVKYGHHQLIHMAIAFLFLGGGRLTFSTDSSSIAFLFISLFPKFAETPFDNSCYLQACRHLYALSIAPPRFIQTRNIATGEECCLPIVVRVDSSSFTLTSPCLLPPVSIDLIEISSPAYYTILINTQLLKYSQQIYVKEKSGFITEKNSLNVTPIKSFVFSSSPIEFIQKIHDLTNDPIVLEFAKTFCSTNQSNIYSELLYRCVLDNMTRTLPIFISIFNILNNIKSLSKAHSLFIDQFKIIFSFYEYFHSSLVHPIFNDSYLSFFRNSLNDFFSDVLYIEMLSKYFASILNNSNSNFFIGPAVKYLLIPHPLIILSINNYIKTFPKQNFLNNSSIIPVLKSRDANLNPFTMQVLSNIFYNLLH